MALSEREQQVLRDLESQLHEDDPELAQTFQREERRLSRPSPRHIGGGGPATSGNSGKKRSSFMDRQSERWDRRRDSED